MTYRVAWSVSKMAGAVSARVWLLVWIARLNWIGMGITAIEIGYQVFKDDELQRWCKKSSFRKLKPNRNNRAAQLIFTSHFSDQHEELAALNEASQMIGIEPKK